jgi:hypothetical protein
MLTKEEEQKAKATPGLVKGMCILVIQFSLSKIKENTLSIARNVVKRFLWKAISHHSEVSIFQVLPPIFYNTF